MGPKRNNPQNGGPKKTQTTGQNKKLLKDQELSTLDTPNEITGNFSTIYPAPESAYHVVSPSDRLDVEDINTEKTQAETKQPDPSSQRSGGESEHVSLNPEQTTQRNDTQAVSSKAPDPSTARDLAAVDELLDAMKRAFSTMNVTFDVLGAQTKKIAELGPAIDARKQIAAAQKEIDDHYKAQENRMQDVKENMLQTISDQSVKLKIQNSISGIVREIVQREIAERVRKELRIQITQEQRNQVSVYKKKLIEVQTNLHNSEARRHNALMRSSSLNEPLKPLLRPFGTPCSPTAGPVTAGGPQSDTAVDGSASSGGKDAKDKKPTTLANTRLDKQKGVGSKPSTTPSQIQTGTQNVNMGPHTDASGQRDSTETSSGKPILPTIITDFADPTPSPLFPKDLTSLMRLSPHETRTLMEDYGLVPVHHAGISMTNPKDSNATSRPVNEPSREEHINRFLNHIGVGIQVVASPNGKTPTTPFVTMMQN